MLRPLLAAALAVMSFAVHADPPHARRFAAHPSAQRPGDDSLERLAARLAERLGARQDTGGDGSLVLRVPSRPAPAGRPPGRRDPP